MVDVDQIGTEFGYEAQEISPQGGSDQGVADPGGALAEVVHRQADAQPLLAALEELALPTAEVGEAAVDGDLVSASLLPDQLEGIVLGATPGVWGPAVGQVEDAKLHRIPGLPG